MISDYRPPMSEVIRFRVPAEFVAALAEAAARDCTTASEYLRRAALEKLRATGVPLPTPGARSRLVQNT